jgi:hypothetical protein
MGMVEQAEGSAIHRQWLEYIFLAVLLKGKVCNPLNLDSISVDKLAHGNKFLQVDLPNQCFARIPN